MELHVGIALTAIGGVLVAGALSREQKAVVLIGGMAATISFGEMNSVMNERAASGTAFVSVHIT